MTPRPRGRPRKGDTRMDAALDAMRQYEFNPYLVRKTVKELLDVYGEDGWFFIEESAYRLLIETLLEKGNEETEDKGNNTLAVTPHTDIVASCPDMQIADTSSHTNKAIESASLSIEVYGPTPLCIEGHDPTLHTNEALESSTPGNEVHDPASLRNKLLGPASQCIEGHDPTLHTNDALESSTPGKEAQDPTSLRNKVRDPKPLCIEGHDPTSHTNKALESSAPGKEARGPTSLRNEVLGHDPTLHINEALESSTPGKEAHDPTSLRNKALDHASPPDQSAEEKGRTSKDHYMEQNVQTKLKHSTSDNHEAAPSTAVPPLVGSPPPYKIISPPPMDAFSHLNRRPYHGWIDSDEELEMIELTPVPLPESLRRMVDRVDGVFAAGNKKSRSRWDVKPDDGA